MLGVLATMLMLVVGATEDAEPASARLEAYTALRDSLHAMTVDTATVREVNGIFLEHSFFADRGLSSAAIVGSFGPQRLRQNANLVSFTDTTTALTSVSKSILRRLDECIVDYSNNVLTLTEFALKCDSLKLSCLDRLSS